MVVTQCLAHGIWALTIDQPLPPIIVTVCAWVGKAFPDMRQNEREEYRLLDWEML